MELSLIRDDISLTTHCCIANTSLSMAAYGLTVVIAETDIENKNKTRVVSERTIFFIKMCYK